jgi:hypothetical protein
MTEAREPKVSEIEGRWSWGWQWPPQWGIDKSYYDGWHFTLHLTVLWIGKSRLYEVHK